MTSPESLHPPPFSPSNAEAKWSWSASLRTAALAVREWLPGGQSNRRNGTFDPTGLLRAPTLVCPARAAGHLPDLANDKLALFRTCSELHGIVRCHVYHWQFHVLTDPGLVHELLVKVPHAFHKTRALKVARTTFGNGLVTSEGGRWKRQQRLIRPSLTPQAVAEYRPLMLEAIHETLSSWPSAAERDVYPDMVDMTLKMVCRALFGVDSVRLQPLICELAHATQQWHLDCERRFLPSPQYWPTPWNLRYRRAAHRLDREVFALIQDRMNGSADDGSLLDKFIKSQGSDGRRMSPRQVRDELVTLFLAGHDTTASALTFAAYELSFRADLQSRIRTELRDGSRASTSETLDHVIKETLRLYPSVYLIGRMAITDVMLGAYWIRKGEEVIVPIYTLHRRSELFERPDEFVPERWQGKPESRHAFIPYSNGPRVCAGQAMATQELRVILGEVLKRFELRPVGDRCPRVLARLTMVPQPGSMLVRLCLRSDEDVRGDHGRIAIGKRPAECHPATSARELSKRL